MATYTCEWPVDNQKTKSYGHEPVRPKQASCQLYLMGIFGHMYTRHMLPGSSSQREICAFAHLLRLLPRVHTPWNISVHFFAPHLPRDHSNLTPNTKGSSLNATASLLTNRSWISHIRAADLPTCCHHREV